MSGAATTAFPSDSLFPGDDLFPGLYRVSFRGPTQEVPFRMEGGLFGSTAYGLSVWRIDGAWFTGLSPGADVEAAADHFFRGGHIHPLSSDEALDLAVGGFGAYFVTEEDL